MRKKYLFALSGIAIIISFLWLFFQESHREWMKYQKDFQRKLSHMIKEELRDISDEKARQRLQESLAHLARSEVEIKQIFVKDLEVIDRCTSCHSGIDDQRFKDEPQPFTRHSEPMLSLHSVERFGCTICHQGQGLATSTRSAHGYTANWKDSLLPLNYIEASCHQCHNNLTFRETPLLARGKYLIQRLGCLGCHKAQGFDQEEKIGPVLDRIKYKVKSDWIDRFLKDPKKYSKETRMPNFKLKDEEIRQIREFLLTLDERDIPIYPFQIPEVVKAPPSPEDMDNGKKLIKDLACTTCHNINGIEESGFFKHDKTAPDLSKAGSKLKREWLQNYLKDPSAYQPGSKMPAYRLSLKEIRELTIFLSSLKEEDQDHSGTWQEKPILRTELSDLPVAIDNERVESGKLLVIKYNCLGCHDIKSIKTGESGPAWDGIASKPLKKFDFGSNPDNIEMSKFAWIKAKILKPRSFRDTLKMPVLDIPEEDALALTTVLLSLTDRKIPRSYLVEDTGWANIYTQIPLTGPVGNLWKEFKCLQCHPVAGKGGNMAPDLAFEGSRIKPQWLTKYLEKPALIRPMISARMPELRLKEQEAKLLSDFIEMSLVDNNLPVGVIQEEKISEKSLKLGKKLFSRRYGCIGCHQVQGKGGKIGPEVTKLGNRLDADWIYAYLKDPQAIIKGAMMPNFALKDEEARALTEYLLSLEGDDLSAEEKE